MVDADDGRVTATTDVLEGLGARLKMLRQAQNATLGEISYATGISISTLSRLESGKRRPNLELLVPIARALSVPLDDIVGKPVDDPRVPYVVRQVEELTVASLMREPGNQSHQLFRIIIPETATVPDTRVHAGTDWLYVLSGRLRLIVGNHDIVMEPGEVAEFSTLNPHWMGSTGEGPVEFLSLFGREGERTHFHEKHAAHDGT